jgi:hypothetical protein
MHLGGYNIPLARLFGAATLRRHIGMIKGRGDEARSERPVGGRRRLSTAPRHGIEAARPGRARRAAVPVHENRAP